MAADYQSLLSCPQCKCELTVNSNIQSCKNCDISYPCLDYIPWLFEEPNAALAEWKEQLKILIQSIDRDAEEIKLALVVEGLAETSIKRMRKHLQAKVEHCKYIKELLSPLDIKDAGSFNLSTALKAKLPKSQNLLSYYENIHRDWVWGDEENSASVDCIEEAFGNSSKMGNLLVMGAGGCRLAYDIHRKFNPTLTVSADINPLLLLAAKKIIRGKTVKLFEFPIAPKDAGSFGVLRKCKAPEKIEKNFEFLFADMMNAPFKAKSFDTIMTPWLIDIIPEDPKQFFPRINELLSEGGKWINFGSLVYGYKEPEFNYSIEEIREIVAESGFEIENEICRKIPYMQSPISNHGRVETVFCFSAKKIRDLQAPPKKFKMLPEWLLDSSLPIPNLPELETLSTVYSIYLEVVNEVDGRKSIKEIASSFGPKHGLEAGEAEQSISRFLTRTYQEAKAGR